MYAPVLITVYNRLDHLRKCVASLERCEGARATTLYISSDAAARQEHIESVKKVREFIAGISGFKSVVPIFHESNKGLLTAYNESFNLIFRDYDRLIFLEDDVVVAPDFLEYLNAGLTFYETNKRVYSISAFSFSLFTTIKPEKQSDVYFANRFLPWGFAIWKDRLISGNDYNINDVRNSMREKAFVERLKKNGADLYPAFRSLLAQHKMPKLDYLNLFHMVRHDLVTVMPYISKSFNIGNDGSGTRTAKNTRFQRVDTSFLETPNPFMLNNEIEKNTDYSFYESTFASKRNTYKTILDQFGLLGLVMKFVNYYKKLRA
jgi:glycosyltransferase involved in cell wall biosynthesis